MDETTHERWRPIPGHPNYEVSDLGRARSWLRRGRSTPYAGSPNTLRPLRRRDGTLRIMPDQKSWLLHRAVMAAFVGPCPDGLEVCHNNGNPADNRLINLRYDTHQSNVADTVAHGTATRGERCGTHKLTLDEVRAIRGLLLETTLSQRAIASKFSISQTQISAIANGKNWQHCL